MNQESFRELVQSGSKAGSSSSTSTRQPKAGGSGRGSLLSSSISKHQKPADASETTFKPRKVKKAAEGKLGYRDRAAERRAGEDNDYAQVEAVLEDFEKRNANEEDIEDKRKYLGGDSEHSILVKGLDVSLLEQNKARAALSTEDDDTLEQAFQQTATTVAPTTDSTGAETASKSGKKRTREDVIREIKEKRGVAPAGADTLQEAKKAGKFKPIGFKPISPAVTDKKKEGVDGEKKKKKKKKRKIEDGAEATAKPGSDKQPSAAAVFDEKAQEKVEAAATKSKGVPEEENEPDVFDIFDGVGEYDGLGDDDNSDDDEKKPRSEGEISSKVRKVNESPPPPTKRNWFLEEGEEPEEQDAAAAPRLPLPPTAGLSEDSRPENEDEEGEEQPMRLQPLHSSALPSIKDLLAMDAQASKRTSKKRKKGKKKGDASDGEGDEEKGKKVTAEERAERDYKRLKSYTDKKAGASK